MEDENKFYSLWKKYLEIISPRYQELEEKRLEKKKKLFKTQAIIILIIAFLILLVIIFPDDASGLIVFCFVACLFGVIWIKGDIKDYSSDIKKIVMEKLLKIFGDNIYHDQKSVKSYESFLPDDINLRKSELFFEYNEIEFDDIIYGTYNDIKFAAAEAEMAMASNKSRIDIFKGIILMYKINKQAKCNTILATKNILTRNNGLIKVFLYLISVFSLSLIIGILDAICKEEYFALIISAMLFIAIMIICLCTYIVAKDEGYYKTFEKVILEDPKFNRRYKVYSSDQIEARYFLTPAFMDRFYNLEKIFKAKNIRCSFCENRLIIAIDTKKDLFEIGSLFKSVKDSETIRQFYEEMSGIFGVIDTLKLDR